LHTFAAYLNPPGEKRLKAYREIPDLYNHRSSAIQSQLDEIGQVLISVSDTGVGLAPQHADKIFSAFFTTKAHGTGMAAACGQPTILCAAHDFASHYPTSHESCDLVGSGDRTEPADWQ
jgi:hypothetical protein